MVCLGLPPVTLGKKAIYLGSVTATLGPSSVGVDHLSPGKEKESLREPVLSDANKVKRVLTAAICTEIEPVIAFAIATGARRREIWRFAGAT